MVQIYRKILVVGEFDCGWQASDFIPVDIISIRGVEQIKEFYSGARPLPQVAVAVVYYDSYGELCLQYLLSHKIPIVIVLPSYYTIHYGDGSMNSFMRRNFTRTEIKGVFIEGFPGNQAALNVFHKCIKRCMN